MPQPASHPATVTDAAAALAAARRVAPVIAAASADIEAQRELPEAVRQVMHAAQLFRLTLPRELGGTELAPADLAEVTRTIAAADASAAWCLGQAFGCAMSAAFLAPASAAEVFGPADAVLAWGAGVAGKAVAVTGGYRVSGLWRFASGGRHATWLGGHCKVFEADGGPRLRADGRQADRTMLFPRSVASIMDDWYVLGLKGTRSEGYAVDELLVDEALSLDRDALDECRHDAPLYRFPTTNVYASVFSGVALGIARAALDDLLDLARHKTARGAASALRDSAVFQTRLAELEARWRAAHAYQQSTLREVWAEVLASGAIALAQRAAIRLATTHAINEATAVVEQVYRLAGSDAIFEGKPFERRFRDIHAVSQQVQGRHSNYETVGRYLLGHEAETLFM